MRNIHDAGQWMRGSFYERFSDIVQKIVMVTLTNVLRSVYINNNFEILFRAQGNELLHGLFIQLCSNTDLVEISTISTTISLILQNKPILVDVPHEYSASFPFSSSIHQWCSAQKSFLSAFRENAGDHGATLNAQPPPPEQQQLGAEEEDDDGKEDEKREEMEGGDIAEGAEGGGPGAEASERLRAKHVDTDSKLQRTKQIADFLKQFMKGSHDPLPALTSLPHNLSALYAADLIWLHHRDLPIDKTSPPALVQLASRYLMTVSAAICGPPPEKACFVASLWIFFVVSLGWTWLPCNMWRAD